MEDLIVLDFDGVVSEGIWPEGNKVIVTGRCLDEWEVIWNYLITNNKRCPVYFNQMPLARRGNHTLESRTYSAWHKADIINRLSRSGFNIKSIYEDDPLQIEIMNQQLSREMAIKIIFIKSEVEK